MTRTPQQTFWSDQALAAARDAVADGHSYAVVNDFADGEQCSWCDCTVADFKGHRCGGCPTPAKYVLRVHDGSPVRRDIPVCDSHHTDAVVFMARHLGGPR